MTPFEPTREQVLAFCAQSPVERVFLEDIARRGLGRFLAVAAQRGGGLSALCHAGANLVPSGSGCGAFAGAAARAGSRMIIGEAAAVTELWQATEAAFPEPREDRPHQPVYVIDEPPPPGGTGLRAATLRDLDRLLPACAAAHELELGIDPIARDADSFRWRTSAQIDEGRSWVWLEDGVVLFKAEASAWTPAGRPAPAGLGRPRGQRAGVRRSRAPRPLPPAPRDDPERHPLRPQRERAGDRPLRGDRDAQGARISQHPVLSEPCSNERLELLARIESHIRRHDLIEPGGEVLCLVSGGADSTCLFHALRELGYAATALHVDHGLRGAESDADAAWCADRLGAEVVQGAARCAAEAELRDVRYSFHADRLRATGHTLSDQVETIVYRLAARGTTKGIEVRRSDGVVRPLLCLWREDTEAFCRERGLEWRTDSSNPDTLRGLIRREILPLLERIHPAARENLLNVLDERRTMPPGLAELLDSPAGSKRVDLGNGQQVVREYDRVWLEAGPEGPRPGGRVGRLADRVAATRPASPRLATRRSARGTVQESSRCVRGCQDPALRSRRLAARRARRRRRRGPGDRGGRGGDGDPCRRLSSSAGWARS